MTDEIPTSNVNFFSDPTVELVQSVGDDMSIIRAARVSVNNDGFGTQTEGGSFAGHDGWELSDKDKGLIKYLMREKHGTPFEHNSITFRVEAPIFVFREFHRHRVFSYNEMSGRYTKLEPEFYIPSPERPLINVGTSSKPEMGPADKHVDATTVSLLKASYEQAWNYYESLLSLGIANEVARAVLPVGIKSKMYVTGNLRAWMGFLSLRTHDKEAAHVSRPQYEIEQVARKVEDELGRIFPVALQYYNEFKRVAP